MQSKERKGPHRKKATLSPGVSFISISIPQEDMAQPNLVLKQKCLSYAQSKSRFKTLGSVFPQGYQDFSQALSKAE